MSVLKLVFITLVILICYKLYKDIQLNIKSKCIGNLGENLIANILSNIPNLGIYRNLYIPIYNNKTTEIDLILLTKHQIYVIESKNYSGSVYGNPGEQQWIVRYANGKSYTFYNPELQNKGHINALKNLLGISDSLITSIIVFGKNSNISNINGVNNCVKVNDIYDLIISREDILSRQGCIPPQYIGALQQTFQKLATADRITKSKHIKQVRHYN